MHAIAGLFGPVIFVMYAIGAVMTMGVMVWYLFHSKISTACLLLVKVTLRFLFAVVLFRSREHENCGPQPGCVRAHIESKTNLVKNSAMD